MRGTVSNLQAGFVCGGEQGNRAAKNHAGAIMLQRGGYGVWSSFFGLLERTAMAASKSQPLYGKQTKRLQYILCRGGNGLLFFVDNRVLSDKMGIQDGYRQRTDGFHLIFVVILADKNIPLLPNGVGG